MSKSKKTTTEEVFKDWLLNLHAQRTLFIYDALRKGGAKRKEANGETGVFDIMLAIAGANDGFKIEMEKRLLALDTDFFETVIRAIGIVKKNNISSKLKHIGMRGGSMETFWNHAFHALCTAEHIRKEKMPLPDSHTMREIVSTWVGDGAYEDLKDWRSVWREIQINPKQQNSGRAKAKPDQAYATFCKGRAFPRAIYRRG